MEETGELRRQLCDTDRALFFLVLTLAGTFLFYLATLAGRAALCRALQGEEPGEDPGVRLRWAGGALITGAVGYFFTVAVDTRRRATGSACPSATRNLWAGALVLAATLLRLWDREAAPLEQAQDPFL